MARRHRSENTSRNPKRSRKARAAKKSAFTRKNKNALPHKFASAPRSNIEPVEACSSRTDVETNDDICLPEILIEKKSQWCKNVYSRKKERTEGEIDSDEYNKIMEEPLCIEREVIEYKVDGYRIVEISYILNRMAYLQREHSKICGNGILKVFQERRGPGLISTITLECSICNDQVELKTEKPSNISKINTGAVWGTLATGGTHGHFCEQLSCMDIPNMSATLFYDIESKLGEEWKRSLLRSMEKAGAIEKQMAIARGHISNDGMPWITVYLDGSWSKRSYGHTYNALSGMAAIIGKTTGQVIYVGIRNKFCAICARAKNRETLSVHNCYKNWSGSASAMEANIIVDGFKNSIAMHGVRFLKFIGDGDSSTFAKIKTDVSYGHQVQKLECTNHALKNFGKHLRKLKKDTSINVQGRKLLSNHHIEHLQRRAKHSIAEHSKTKNLILLRTDLKHGMYHVFGDHHQCREEVCNVVGDVTNNKIPELKSTNMFYHLQGALELLIRKAHLLIENENNNISERLMNTVARFNMGKRLNLIQRGSYERRVYLAGLRYNNNTEWHASPWKKVTACSPGKFFKKYIRKSTSNLESKARRRLFVTNKKKKTITNRPVNRDYGPYAEMPEESEEFVAKETEELISHLQVSEDNRKEILDETLGQFINERYVIEKSKRLTASNFGRVIKRRPHTSCHNIVKSCLGKNSFITKATEYGLAKEAVAISIFEKEYDMKVSKSGLFVDKNYGFLGASPDGLIGTDAVVEVKCLYITEPHSSLEEIIKKKNTFLKLENSEIKIKQNHNYYYQIQGQLNISERNICYLIVYVSDNIKLFVQKIYKDEIFWRNAMLPPLTLFYKLCIGPEIIRNNLGKQKKCVDPQFILDAIAKKEKKNLT